MDAKTATFTAIAIRTQGMADLPKRLRQYSKSSVYRALDILKEDDLVEVRGGLVSVATNSRAQRLKGIHVLAVTHGIDPERLLRDSYLQVWKAIEDTVTLEELVEETSLSYSMVRKIVKFFRRAGLVTEVRLKPLEVEKSGEHPVNQALEKLIKRPGETVELPYPGRLTSIKLAGTPTATESLLHDELEEGVSIGGQDWSWSYGGGKESIDVATILEELGREEVFLDQLKTIDGVQEFCLHMLTFWELDYGRLLELSKEQDYVNQVGCWLNLVQRFAPDLVKEGVVEEFLEDKSGKMRVFPEGVKALEGEPRPEWVKEYEDKWNVELRFSIAALAQEARNI